MIIGTGTDLSYLNYGNNDLTGDIILSQIVTTNDVTDMRYMFANCPNITSVTAYEYTYHKDTSTYTHSYEGEFVDSYNIRYSYEHIFSYTYTYTSVDNFKQVKSGFVKNMNHMFANCYNLTTANLSYMNISNCVDMQCMFQNCYNLETVVFGRYACSDTVHTQDIFRGCDRLAYVYVPFELRDKIGNIIGPSGIHSYYYNANYNIEDTLPEIHVSYEMTNIQEVERYTTLTVNKIGALIVEQDFPNNNAPMYVLDMYINSPIEPEYDLIFSYQFEPSEYAVELSDICDAFSHTMLRSNEFNLLVTLSGQLLGGKELFKELTYTISNNEELGYIGLNTYLIYFSDNENAETTVYGAAKSKILLSTDPFFSDVQVNKDININTFEYEYTYESGFDSYNGYLTLNNELSDPYDGPQTYEPVYVDYVYVDEYTEE